MELILVLVVAVIVGALIYFNRSAHRLDINKDGKIDAADAVAAVQQATESVKSTVKKAAVRAKTANRPITKKTTVKKTPAKPRAKK
jgi:hypothetical protein